MNVRSVFTESHIETPIVSHRGITDSDAGVSARHGGAGRFPDRAGPRGGPARSPAPARRKMAQSSPVPPTQTSLRIAEQRRKGWRATVVTGLLHHFSQNPVLVLFLLIGLGMGVGHVKVKGVSLGAAAVLFAGIALAAWGTSEGAA